MSDFEEKKDKNEENEEKENAIIESSLVLPESEDNKFILTDEQKEETLKEIEKQFKFDSDIPERLQVFAKYLIMCGGNATEAIKQSGLTNTDNYHCQRTLASTYLRKLRKYPNFWDMIGLGYADLKEVVDELKKTKPEKAIDIIMKVNKEDTERIEGEWKIVISSDLQRKIEE